MGTNPVVDMALFCVGKCTTPKGEYLAPAGVGKSTKLNVTIDNTWMGDAWWFRNLTGGTLTLIIVIAVAMVVVCALGLAYMKVTGAQSKATVATLLIILVGATAAASMSGIVKYGGAWVNNMPAIEVYDESGP